MTARLGQRLRPGDLVEVRSWVEIQRSLDSNGTRDGLPFMPEMLPFCGQKLHVSRRVGKLCYEAPHMEMRTFPTDDVFFLEDLRCSGADHDGCQNGCLLLWKEAWLRQPLDDQLLAPSAADSSTALPTRLCTRRDRETLVCQATEIGRATSLLSRPQRAWRCLADYRDGNHSAREVVRWIVRPLTNKVLRAIRGDRPQGSQTRTPSGVLSLEPGDWVEVKSAPEIIRTLDANGKNRGLHFSEDMLAFCGLRFRVRSRLDRMMIESTGRLRDVRNTVILEGATCHCMFTLGGCPRKSFQYWREIWLRRAPAPAAKAPAAFAEDSSE